MKSKKIWLYGKHTCFSALNNPHRKCYRLFVTKRFLDQNQQSLINLSSLKKIKPTESTEQKLFHIFNKDVNHQGIALEVDTLSGENYCLEKILVDTNNKSSMIVILDQITDIHNVGSIIRTSACFHADAIIMTKFNTASENSTMAKTSSGAIDLIPIIYTTNLINVIKMLKDYNYWIYGFDGHATQSLNNIKNYSKKIALIFGSEEKGMRRLTKDNCDFLVKIPISDKIDSLNVSNAAAIALYHASNAIYDHENND